MEPQQGSDQPPVTPPSNNQVPQTPLASATVNPDTTSVSPNPTQPLGVPGFAGSAQTPSSPSKKSNLVPVVIIIVVLLLLLIGGAFVVMHKTAPAPQPAANKTSMIVKPTSTALPTPIITPVTAANVDSTLNNTDSSVQKAVTQANTDLNSINSIDTTQDSTNNL